jgi:hypothetical protein
MSFLLDVIASESSSSGAAPPASEAVRRSSKFDAGRSITLGAGGGGEIPYNRRPISNRRSAIVDPQEGPAI